MTRRLVEKVYTLGHSNHALEHFLELLGRHAVETVADVRSRPFSRFVRHFSKDRLERILAEQAIGYLYLGRELGGKPVRDDPPVARLDYAVRVGQPAFRTGIARLLEAASQHRVAIVCRERDPLDCHRLHLICRYIKPMVGEIRHILPDGRIEAHATTERRLVERAGMAPAPLFEAVADRSGPESTDPDRETVERAYERCWPR